MITIKHKNIMKHENCNKCKERNIPCGCKKEITCGCEGVKVDLLCSNYTGPELPNSGIPTGETGNEAIVKLDKYIKSVEDMIEQDSVLIESIGDKIPIYKGMSITEIHEIKSIIGTSGVIVENVASTAAPCAQSDDYLDVHIDKEWLKKYILYLFQSGEIDICQLTQNCAPPVPRVAPEVFDFTINIPFNSGSRVFTDADFINHFSDADGDVIKNVTFLSGTDFNTFNGNNVSVGQTMDFVDISAGGLRFNVNPQGTAGYTQLIEYQVQDTGNMTSNVGVITVNVLPKVFIVLNDANVTFERGVSDTKNATVTFTNGTGQTLTTNTVLITNNPTLPPGQPGYLKVTPLTNVTLNGTGSFDVKITHYPTTNAVANQKTYTIDGSQGNINFDYFSAPTTQNIVKTVANRGQANISKPIDLDPVYSDLDGDALTAIMFYNDVAHPTATNHLFYPNPSTPYISGTEIPIGNLHLLTYKAPNVNNLIEVDIPYRVKDATGKWSV